MLEIAEEFTNSKHPEPLDDKTSLEAEIAINKISSLPRKASVSALTGHEITFGKLELEQDLRRSKSVNDEPTEQDDPGA